MIGVTFLMGVSLLSFQALVSRQNQLAPSSLLHHQNYATRLRFAAAHLTLLAVKNFPEPPLQRSVLCTAKERVKDQSTGGAASIGGGDWNRLGARRSLDAAS